jgi:hypothetical protein
LTRNDKSILLSAVVIRKPLWSCLYLIRLASKLLPSTSSPDDDDDDDDEEEEEEEELDDKVDIVEIRPAADRTPRNEKK